MDNNAVVSAGRCSKCGQHHRMLDPHLYDYEQYVDEDLTCYICLQPYVSPLDLPCGHTFCERCISNFFRIQQTCPIDRQLVASKDFKPPNLVLKKWIIRVTSS